MDNVMFNEGKKKYFLLTEISIMQLLIQFEGNPFGNPMFALFYPLFPNHLDFLCFFIINFHDQYILGLINCTVFLFITTVQLHESFYTS